MVAALAPALELVAPSPGPIGRVVGWLDTQGSRAWLWIAALTVVLFAWAQGGWWLIGQSAIGHIDRPIVSGLPYAPFSLATMVVARKIARRSLDDFWPATGFGPDARVAWEQAFGPLTARDEWLAILVGVVGGTGAYLGGVSALLPTTPTALEYAVSWPAYVAGYLVSTVAIANSVRWVRAVARIHGQATAIDPFDRRPIYAFSRLTVFLGVVLVSIAYYSFAANNGGQQGNVVFLGFLVTAGALGLVAFIAPLWGIHGRLVRIKAALELDVDRRINGLATEIYGRIDGGSIDAASPLTSTLGGLMTLRDRVGRLPTWPWPPQVLRGFLTALLLPLLVVVGGRFLSTLIGS